MLQEVLGEAAVAGVESLGLGTEYDYKVDTFNWIYFASIKTLKPYCVYCTWLLVAV